MITLNDFFANTKTVTQTPVVWLKSSQYFLLFSRLFVQSYAYRSNRSLELVAMKSDTIPATMASLHSSFLGQELCYWLGSDESLSKKQLESWHKFLKQYTGPHTLIFSSATISKPSPSWVVVEIPSMVDKKLFQQIAQMAVQKIPPFQTTLFKETKTVPIDTAVMLAQYGAVVGKNSAQFSKEWLPKMIVGETSLFALSQALFERNSSDFFRLWKAVNNQYRTPFWITFWAEQMWRAHWYIQLQQKRKLTDAKKMSYRLPFSFLRQQWRRYTLQELEQAHALLYDIDFHLKNGGTAYSLDLFFSLFLS